MYRRGARHKDRDKESMARTRAVWRPCLLESLRDEGGGVEWDRKNRARLDGAKVTGGGGRGPWASGTHILPRYTTQLHHRCGLPCSASLGYTHYLTQVDTVDLRHTFVTFGMGQSPGAPNWWTQTDSERPIACLDAIANMGFQDSDWRGQRGACLLHSRRGLPLTVPAIGCRVSGFGFRVSDFGFQFSGFGFRVSGFGFRGIPNEFNLDGLREVVVGQLARVVAEPVPLRERLEVLVTALGLGF